MNKQIKQLFIALVLLSALNSTAFAQGTAFTYQGQLQNNGSLASGTYNLTFTLFTNSAGGTDVAGPVTNNAITVTNGLFTVVVDFGATVWNGETNWLEIGVETNGAATFTTLAPRQQLTPTPYAIYAENVPAAGVSGTLVDAQLTHSAVTVNPGPGLSGGGRVGLGNTIILTNTGVLSISGNGDGLTNVNAATLGGLASSGFWITTGNVGTSPANGNYIGTADNQALELHVDGQRAFRLESALFDSVLIPNVIGGSLGNYVVPGTLGATIGGGGTTDSSDPNDTNVVSGNFSTIAGGVGNTILDNLYEASIGGGYKNCITNGGLYGTISGGDQNTAAGEYATVPGGYNNLAAGAYSFAAGDQAQALNTGTFVWADDSVGSFGSTGNNQFLIRAAGGVGIGTTTPADPLDLLGGDNWNLSASEGDFRIGNPTYRLKMGVALGGGGAGDTRIYASGGTSRLILGSNTNDVLTVSGTSVGIGTLSPSQALEVNGHYVLIDGANADNENGPIDAYIGGNGSGSDVQVGSMNPNITSVAFYNFAYGGWMHISCSAITINGGADVAEPFPVSSASGEIPQGSVVVIDDQNPGHLKVSDQAYDTHVAGVISGANGISPGIQMQQQGILEGGKNVALTGRVYVLADASNGPIKPGDMLTTSSRPGHAMKVSDHARAQGAILGKAMTGLSEGKGMVLVLVTLQ